MSLLQRRCVVFTLYILILAEFSGARAPRTAAAPEAIAAGRDAAFAAQRSHSRPGRLLRVARKDRCAGCVAARAYDCGAATGIAQIECEALVALYNATGGENWTLQDGWLQTAEPCGWFGVTCAGGQVGGLALYSNHLVGGLPPEIGDLAALEQLGLYQNQLSGLPPEIGLLTRLKTLRLSDNKLTALPPQIGNLASLNWLGLSDNTLSSVPPEIGGLGALELLSLSGNQLTALPPQIGNLTSLAALGLAVNQLSGLPPQIGNLTRLESLVLDSNLLSSLPPEIGGLASLRGLGLADNQLTSLPPEIGDLAQLNRLILEGNQLRGLPPEIGSLTGLTSLNLDGNRLGSLPPEIGNLTGLTELYLSGNQLTGLPPQIGNLVSLSTLQLYRNRLTSLPPEIGNLTHLRVLELWENQLTSLPPEIGNLSGLDGVNVNRNRLSSLPPEIGDLTHLEWLSASDNLLTSLPPEIGNLTDLTSLGLAYNQLSSLTPRIGNLRALKWLTLQGNLLAGLPSEVGDLTSLESLDLSDNLLSSLPAEIGDLIRLATLKLGGNRLRTLPPEIGDLTGVVELELGNNELTGLPPEVGNLSNLVRWEVNGNPLAGPLPAFLTGMSSLDWFVFYDTAWCVASDDPSTQSWLAKLSALDGTGFVCGRAPGGLSGRVTGGWGQPLPGIYVALYRRTGYPDAPVLVLADATTTDAGGVFGFGELGEGIDYRLYFADGMWRYAPEYYDDARAADAATGVTVTLGVTRTGLDATLDAPRSPLATVNTARGVVNVDPLDGRVVVSVVDGEQADVTVRREVTCSGGLAPNDVALEVWDGTNYWWSYPMAALGNGVYETTIPGADIRFDHDLRVGFDCDGTPEALPIGGIDIYTPSGVIRDVETGAPVAGATVTLYQVPGWRPRSSPADTRPDTCESNRSKAPGTLWSQPAPQGLGVIANPDVAPVQPRLARQATDGAGRYGWELPEGCWYVRVTAPGHAPQFSPVVGASGYFQISDLDLALIPLDHAMYLSAVRR